MYIYLQKHSSAIDESRVFVFFTLITYFVVVVVSVSLIYGLIFLSSNRTQRIVESTR